MRDSFRVIKHSLIEMDNNLKASNFHKLELYAKEIELKNKLKNETNKSQASILLDRIMLLIYRTTSDHHTNLLTILNFTIMMIAILE
ncbi:hypothetical protein [Campylobacter blaseri]|uniref:Uncharacterized protein n=2 Tax=Campylobacter blaseri TaxID=2042961 RepID=A0A2P8R082_9BACT|nr:hypothetical protein [Campylobacter blaseri]PSM51892.1 hypothetical protein CQ405_04825 [Campylobacter blaseri]PSM53676.1 hypothetical protein CRN67_04825 [Campylobacter blaseri]